MGPPSPKRLPFMDLTRQHAPIKRELLKCFSDALDTCRFIGGQELEAFEIEFASFVGTRYCVGVNSGTDALRFALLALGVGPGDVVVTTPNTFIATTEAISQTGARFEFVDIDLRTSLMDIGALADTLARHDSCGKRIKAIVPVHLYGQCVEMETLHELANRYGALICEDAAQAHGASRHGRMAGSMGMAAGFSFYPGKNLGACGEAGAVTTDDKGIAETVRALRDHGQSRKYVHHLEGYNGRLDAIQAAVLRVKLPFLPAWNVRRRDIAARYDAVFAKLDGISPVGILPSNVSARHLYVIHVPRRDDLIRHLAALLIDTGLHYPIPLHMQQCYARLGYGPGSFPNAERAAQMLLSLPLYPEMTDDEVDRVIAAIKDFAC